MADGFEAMLAKQISEMEERRAKLHAELSRIDGNIQGLKQALRLFQTRTQPRLAMAASAGEVHASSLGELGELMAEQEMARRPPDPAKSPSWAFVLSELTSAPEAGLSVDELEDRLKGAGHTMAKNTLLANLSVASRTGIVERVKVGHYRRSPLAALADILGPADMAGSSGE